MKRGILVLSIIGSFLLAMLSGCAADSSEAGDTNSENGKPTLQFLGFYASNISPNDDISAKDIEEVTGYDVKYFMLPQEQQEEKLNIELASGKEYDIATIWADQFYDLVAQGALLPLDDLLEGHGSNIKNAISEESWGLTTYDGKIYGIPYKTEKENFEDTIFYRQDILDELNLQAPETTEELLDVLKVVKNKYPDMIPLTGTGMAVPTIYSAFGLYTDWTDVEGKLVPRIKMPHMKEYMEYMKKLYTDGLLDADWAVNKKEIKEEKFVSGKAFMMVTRREDSLAIKPNLLNNVPEAEIGYLQPLKDDEGNAGMNVQNKLIRVSVIPKASKHPEHAVKFMDIKLEPENFEFLALGEEGIHFEKEGDKYIPIEPAFSEKRTNSYWYMNGMDERVYPDMWLARLRKSDAMIEAFENINKDFDKYKKYDPTSSMPPLSSITNNQSVLEQMEDDYFIQVLLGERALDGFDNFIKEWEEAGGSEMIDEVNDWYAEK